MAELTIRLVVDPTTRKKNVVISYRSDEDALPMEHEDAHRALVEKLIEGGALKASELGKIVVTREAGPEAAEAPSSPASDEERRSVEEKG